MAFFGAKSTLRHGYVVEEVVSALQKSIRRGLEPETQYWLSEMDLSGFGNAAWNRLKIIVAEDVGLGNIDATATIFDLFDRWQQIVKSGGSKSKFSDSHRYQDARNILLAAGIYLCRSSKSRMAATASAVALLESTVQLSDTDITTDISLTSLESSSFTSTAITELTSVLKHCGICNNSTKEEPSNTQRALFLFSQALLHRREQDALRLGVLLYEWTDDTAFSKEAKDIDGEADMYNRRTRWSTRTTAWLVMRGVAAAISSTMRKYIVQYSSAYQETENRLWYTLSILHICRHDSVVAPSLAVELQNVDAWYARDIERKEVPDYARDKHTRAGKKLGRGVEHFFQVGAVVTNEALPDPYAARALELYKEQENKFGTKHRTHHIRRRMKLLFKNTAKQTPSAAGRKRPREEDGEAEKPAKRKRKM